MKVLSWNVNGLGDVRKRDLVREIIIKAEPDVVYLQETKLQAVDSFVVGSLWDSRHKEWMLLPSEGASGGILVLWDTRFASKVESIIGYFTVSVRLLIKGRGEWWFTAVYGPCTSASKALFWMELSGLAGLCSPRWLLGGDFHVVRQASERRGLRGAVRNMRDFDDFIRECGLRDPKLENAQFTWVVGGQRNVASRLERFLFTNEVEDEFPLLVQEALPRPCSDHFPLLIHSQPIKWGPSPFRFENMWTSHPTFRQRVGVWWQEIQVQGWYGYRFMKKLGFVKTQLKEWNLEVFGNTRAQKEEVLGQIRLLDQNICTGYTMIQ